jgi:lipopolysaccharide transport system permease protein
MPHFYENMTKITTYQPDNSLKGGYFSLFKDIYRELRDNSWLIQQLFRRDFFALYKQSFIGILWVLIMPLLSIGTFIIMNQAGVFSIGDISAPYPIYALLGMAYWQLFSTGLLASANSLVNAGGMITKINFSKKSLVIAATGQSIVAFIIQMALVSLLFVYYSFAPNSAIVFFPLLIIPVMLFTLGLGFMLSLLNGVARDFGNMLSVFLTFLLFLTPILYAKPKAGFLETITQYNPIYHLVSAPRELILTGTLTDPMAYLLSCGLSLVVFIIFLLIFHLTETRVAERI